MTSTYTNATVTFSDGSEREFSCAVVHENQTLEASTRQVFTPSRPRGVDEAARWNGGPAEVVDTVHFAAHEWRSISQPPKEVLCAVIRDAKNPSEAASVYVVRNSVAHDDDVAGLVRGFLESHGGTNFEGYFGNLRDRKFLRPGVLPAERAEVLSASYLIGSVSRDEARIVQFRLEKPPPPPEKVFVGV